MTLCLSPSVSVKASCVSGVFVTRPDERQLLLRGRRSRVHVDVGRSLPAADRRPQPVAEQRDDKPSD